METEKMEFTQHVLDPSADFFKRPVYCTQIEREYYLAIRPLKALDEEYAKSGGTITIKVDRDLHYTNLAQSFFYVRVKLVKLSNDNKLVPITSTDKISTINNAGPSLIRELDIQIEDVSVTIKGFLYSFKAFLEMLKRGANSNANKKFQLMGFCKDTPGKHDSLLTAAIASDNKGLKQRRDLFVGGTGEFIVLIDHDAFRNGKLLPSLTKLGFKLHLNTSDFYLMYAKDETTKFDFQVDCKLYLRKVVMEANANLAIDHVLSYDGGEAVYPYTEEFAREFVCSRGQSSFYFLPSQVDIKPLWALFGIVKTAALLGDPSLSPYNFQPWKVKEFTFSFSNEIYPIHEIRPKFTNTDEHSKIRSYVDFLNYLKIPLNSSDDPTIDLSDYENGLTLYAVQFQPSIISDNCHSKTIQGPLSFKITFEENLEHNLSIVLYLQYSNILTIGADRKPHLKYNF